MVSNQNRLVARACHQLPGLVENEHTARLGLLQVVQVVADIPKVKVRSKDSPDVSCSIVYRMSMGNP